MVLRSGSLKCVSVFHSKVQIVSLSVNKTCNSRILSATAAITVFLALPSLSRRLRYTFEKSVLYRQPEPGTAENQLPRMGRSKAFQCPYVFLLYLYSEENSKEWFPDRKKQNAMKN